MRVRRWYLAFWLLLCLALLVGVCNSGSAQTENLPSSQSDTNQLLDDLLTNWKMLKEQLQQRKIAYEQAVKLSRQLENELLEARSLLESSLISLGKSEQEIARLSGLLQLSDETLNDLRETFSEYQRTATAKIRSGWILGGLIGLLVGLLAGLLLN